MSRDARMQDALGYGSIVWNLRRIPNAMSPLIERIFAKRAKLER